MIRTPEYADERALTLRTMDGKGKVHSAGLLSNGRGYASDIQPPVYILLVQQVFLVGKMDRTT